MRMGGEDGRGERRALSCAQVLLSLLWNRPHGSLHPLRLPSALVIISPPFACHRLPPSALLSSSTDGSSVHRLSQFILSSSHPICIQLRARTRNAASAPGRMPQPKIPWK